MAPVVTFIFLALLMTVGALGVVTLRQPVHAALSLVGTLLTLAITYITLQAHFLAAVQVIVYAGAIMVLFLFVIMLLNAQGDEGKTPLGWLRPLAYLVGGAAALALAGVMLVNRQVLPSADVVNLTLGGGGADAIGAILFPRFVLAFQLVGVLLLTAIIAAVALVQRRSEGLQGPALNALTVAAGEEARAAENGPSAQTPTGRRDDLKRIKGIGPKLEGLLHENGITTFAQLAALSDDEVLELDEQLGEFKGRIHRDAWLEQARDLAREMAASPQQRIEVRH